MFPKVLHIPFPILLGLVELINRRIYVAHVSSHILPQGLMVGTISKPGLRTVRHIIMLRNSIILAYNAVALYYSLIGGPTNVVLIEIRKHTIPVLLLAWHIWACISIRIYYHNLLAGKPIDFISGLHPVVFSLRGGQEVTSLFTGKGKNPHLCPPYHTAWIWADHPWLRRGSYIQ